MNPTDEMDAGITAREILQKANTLDKMIMQDIMAGRSYDEIADKYGISKALITLRMKKYRRDAE